MIGIPGETASDIEETIVLNKRIKPVSIGLSVLKPYPGTPMYDYCKNQGMISSRTTESYFEEKSLLNQECISQKEISYYWRIFKPSVRSAKMLPLIKFGAHYLIIARHYEILRYVIKKILPLRIKNYISRILKRIGITS